MPVPPLPFAVTNAHDLGRSGQIGWRVIRRAVPRTYRFLYEGEPGLSGLMWFEDRRVLYNVIRTVQPQRCFEVGTWLGGGSTLVIATALRQNQQGVLHTIELDPDIASQARSSYEQHLQPLLPYVRFHRGDYADILPSIIEREQGVDFVILDGAEDAEQTMRQFLFFERCLEPGAVVVAHDWNTDKSAELRPYLETSRDWDIRQVAGPPKSVGIAVAVRS
jgi:predicted O-methyltransferase YrrM